MKRMTLGATSLFCLMLLVVAVGPASAGISRIWAVDDGEKVKKTDNDHPLAVSPDNPVWDGRRISLFAARNEVVAFQLIIEANGSAVKGVDVSLDSLTNGPYVIENTGSSDPFDYRGKRIEFLTEHYVEVTKGSGYYSGWVPDCLIPFAAPRGLGGAPFDIAANSNQAVWVDIWVPRDAVPGTYTGNVRVSVESVVTHTIPASLQVCDLILPDECHLKNMFVQGDWPAGSGIVGRHGVAAGTAAYHEIERRYFQMAYRHRFDIVKHVQNLAVMTDRYRGYMDGRYYTPAHGYEGPGENTGNGTFSVGPYNARPEEFSPDTEAGWRAGSDAWVNWFRANAPHVEIHKYLRDEPYSHGPVYDDIIERCQWIHNNPGPGSALATYVACPIISELQGHCDFWSMQGNGYYLPDAVHEQAQGRKCSFYNGDRPFYGETSIDTDAIDFRVQPWICWRYNVDQYFYWSTTKWPAPQDLFGRGHRNGSGTFFYPGEDKVIPSSSRRLPGPLSSIRMKNWRRGMQDYEYLWLAKQAGLGSEADAIVKSCVPSALSEAAPKQDIGWPTRGHGFELYRRQLADLIARNVGTIGGVVIDAATGKPIPKARVTDGIGEDTTGATGTYAMDVLPGTRTVTTSATGYNDAVQRGVMVTENQRTSLDLQLTRDTAPPVISGVQVERISSAKATITWSTDEPSNSLVRYGTSPGAYRHTARGLSHATSHSVDMHGLSPGRAYYFTVSSTDEGGNSATSAESEFTALVALDLVGLWRFDEGRGASAQDTSGHGNNGVLFGGPRWVEGRSGKALEFDGVDDAVRCPNSASLDGILDEMTFVAWVKPFKADGCIVKKWDWGHRTGYHLDINPKYKTLNLIMGYPDRSALILGLSLGEHLNKYSHIAFTASDSEVVFYLNGHAVSNTIPRKPIHLRNSTDVYIGGGSGWSGHYFNGVIDEARIYARALSAHEIEADYQSRAARPE